MSKEKLSNEAQNPPLRKTAVISRFVVHYYADDEGDMSECGRGFFADVSFENGTSDKSKVTCKQCLKALCKNGL
jgi:hypothetical protein